MLQEHVVNINYEEEDELYECVSQQSHVPGVHWSSYGGGYLFVMNRSIDQCLDAHARCAYIENAIYEQ